MSLETTINQKLQPKRILMELAPARNSKKLLKKSNDYFMADRRKEFSEKITPRIH